MVIDKDDITRAAMPHAKRHRLDPDVLHDLPEQKHQHTRGHQVHLDVSEHTDEDSILRYDSEVSTDGGKTWSYGGGFTRQGGPPPVDKVTGEPQQYLVVAFGHEPHPTQSPAKRRLVRSTLTVVGQGPVHTKLHVCGIAQPHMDLSAVPKD